MGTLRIGVVGTGAIGTEHARTLARRVGGATVTGVFDVDTARAAALAAELSATAHDSAEALVASADVDAVVIASAGFAHAAQVHACLAAGKPVLCEKPLASTLDDARAVVAAEAVGGRRLVQVGFMRRFDPGYREVKAAVDAGTIGVPLIVHCVHRNPGVPPGFTSEMAMTDSAVHEFDIVRWLLDDEPAAVRVLTPRRSPTALGEHHDPQIAIVEMAGGAIVDIEVVLSSSYGYDVRCQVVGADGIATLEHPRLSSIVTAAGSIEGVPDSWQTRFGDTYRIELQAWVDSLVTGVPVGASAYDGYVATATAAAAVRALQTGERIAVDLDERPALYR